MKLRNHGAYPENELKYDETYEYVEPGSNNIEASLRHTETIPVITTSEATTSGLAGIA